MPDLDQMSTKRLLAPILLENLLRLGVFSVDIFMLSVYSVDAVAAVGVANNYVFFLVIIFMVVSTGTSIVLGQYIGAGENRMAARIIENSLFLTYLVSALMALLFHFSAPVATQLFQLDPSVLKEAEVYLVVIGVFSLGQALIGTIAVVLRAYGLSLWPTLVQVVVSVLNIAGNFLALFYSEWWFAGGVLGVALATVISQSIGAALSFAIAKFERIPFQFSKTLFPSKKELALILRFGLPSSGEILSYNAAQLVLSAVITGFGVVPFFTFTVVQSIARIVFVLPMSVGQCAQILTSYYVGRRQFDLIVQKVRSLALTSLSIVVVTTYFVWFLKAPISSLYSTDPLVWPVVASLLFVLMIIEPPRSINLVIIAGLKGAGDVLFPAVLGVCSMWLISVGLGIYFSVFLELGLVGVFIAIALDEAIRALFVWRRWGGQRWTEATVF